MIHPTMTVLALAASAAATGAMLLTVVVLEPLTAGWSDEDHRAAKGRLRGGADTVMPAVVITALVLSLGSALTAGTAPAWPAAAAAVALAAVVVVSLAVNVPLNRTLARPPEPGSRATPQTHRRHWRHGHVVRSGLAVLATALLVLADLTGGLR